MTVSPSHQIDQRMALVDTDLDRFLFMIFYDPQILNLLC